ncbi:MAG: hypothetical protein ACI867_000062 [Glaciecola sp.]|jgi:hypothetical protein
MAGLRTEFSFLLPKGWIDTQGGLHREGRMRLATARDELEVLADPDLTGANDPRLALLVLSRVIVRLGERERMTPRDLQMLFAADLAHLQDVYGAINYGTQQDIERVIGHEAAPAALTAIDVESPAMSAPAMSAPAMSAPAVAPAPMPPGVGQGRPASPVVPEPRIPSREPIVAAATIVADASADDEPTLVARAPATGRRARIEEVGRSGRPNVGGR